MRSNIIYYHNIRSNISTIIHTYISSYKNLTKSIVQWFSYLWRVSCHWSVATLALINRLALPIFSWWRIYLDSLCPHHWWLCCWHLLLRGPFHDHCHFLYQGLQSAPHHVPVRGLFLRPLHRNCACGLHC